LKHVEGCSKCIKIKNLFINLVKKTIVTRYYPVDHIKKSEIGGAVGTHGRKEWCIHVFGVET